MSALSGKVGLVEHKGGQVAGIRNWSMDVDTNMLDVTSFATGEVQWRSMIPGLTGANGTFAGFYDADSTGQADIIGGSTIILSPTTATLKLYMDKVGGEHFNVPAYISGGGFAADIDGTVDANFSFTAASAVTFATST
jgi:predicted secreted protein